MPELNELLQSASDAIMPSPAASFEDVQRRFRRRRLRRGTVIGALVLITGAAVGVAIIPGGHREATLVAPQPCVPRSDLNARDTFLAVPKTGIQQVEVQVGSIITLGWPTCGESGDVEFSDPSVKQGSVGAPGTGLPVDWTDVASARFQVFHAGTVRLTGHGTYGSAGALEITIVPFVEPAGPSSPSPYPGEDVNPGVPPFCLTPDGVDGSGHVSKLMSLSNATIAPAPGAASRHTASGVLQRFRTDEPTRGIQGHPQAVFGLFTDRYSSPFPQDRPLWVVVVCDAPLLNRGGPGDVQPTAAPGTSPSPGGRLKGLVVVPYDENGHWLGETYTGYADAALRAEMLFEVPFERNHQDASAGRQIGLTYRSDDACSTFDHLLVSELPGGPVYVQVWLRLTGGNPSCTGSVDTHNVVVGLRSALNNRPLVRGVQPR